MPIENPTQPVLPLINALRKRKLRVELLGDTAQVWREKDAGPRVEVYDLIRDYATGASALNVVVDKIEARATDSPRA